MKKTLTTLCAIVTFLSMNLNIDEVLAAKKQKTVKQNISNESCPVPKHEETLINHVKRLARTPEYNFFNYNEFKGVKIGSKGDHDGSYEVRFVYKNEIFRVTYEDKNRERIHGKPDGKINHYDGLGIEKDDIQRLDKYLLKHLNDEAKKDRTKNSYTYETEDCGTKYLIDENLDGHGGNFSISGHVPTLKCNIPYDNDSKKLNNLIDQANSAIATGNIKPAKHVYLKKCN